MRRHHMWGSIFFVPQDEMLVVTRPQRVLILTATCIAAMSVNAVFFGSSPARVSATVITSLLAAVVMMPIERLGPMLFALVNTFRANTSAWKRDVKLYKAVTTKREQRLRHLASSSGEANEVVHAGLQSG